MTVPSDKPREEPAVAAMTRRGVSYDPQTERARQRRAKGMCGYCGHPAHWRLEGCDLCGPEGCPVIFEVTDPSTIEQIAAKIAPDAKGAVDAE